MHWERVPVAGITPNRAATDQEQSKPSSEQPASAVPALANCDAGSRRRDLRITLSDPQELKFYVVRRLDALLAILREASANQAIQRGRGKRLRRRDGLWFVFQDGGNDAGLALAVERVISGDHLIQHGAEGEQIATRVRFFSLQLLRRHVLHGTHNR